MDIARNDSGYPVSAGTWEAPSHNVPPTNTTPPAGPPFKPSPQHSAFRPSPQYFPPAPVLVTPSNPFANTSGGAPSAVTPLGGASYSTAPRQGMPPKKIMPPQKTQQPTWSDINYRNERINDIINGTHNARTNFASAYNAWKNQKYTDALLDFYQGISSTMRALRGSFGLGGVYADGMDRQNLAKAWKNTASYIDAARRVLDLVASPLSSFRSLAQTLSDSSSTSKRKLLGIADYMDQLAQSSGLAILRMDRRSSETLLQYFGYALFTGGAANQAARQAIKGYQDAVRMLHTDPKTAVMTALGATQTLFGGAQAVFEYLADAFSKVGMENQAGVLKNQAAALKNHANTMYMISAHLLATLNVIDTSVIVKNQLSKT